MAVIGVILVILGAGTGVYFMSRHETEKKELTSPVENQEKLPAASDSAATGAKDESNAKKAGEIKMTASKIDSCPFPATSVPEHGYAYGKPEGWRVDFDDTGILEILKEEGKDTTAAFIYTARLEANLSPSDFLNQFGQAFKKGITEDGGIFSHEEPVVNGNRAEAKLSARVENIDVRGSFGVEKTSDFVTLKGYWAPVKELADEEEILKQILRCYSRKVALTDKELRESSAEAAGLVSFSDEKKSPWGSFVSKSDGQFEFEIPSGWNSKVSESLGESPVTSLTLDAPTGDASVAFVVNMNRYGVTNSAEFAQVVLGVNFGVQANLGKHETVNNSGRAVDVYDFTGTFQGFSVAGTISINVQPFQTFYVHYAGIQMALSEKWAAYAPFLNVIQGTIRFIDASGALASLPSLPRYTTETLFGASPSAVAKAKKNDSNPLDKWADAMRGYEEVESPTTGQRYDAPINSWNPTGPEGAGYYRQLPGGGGLEKLSPLNK